MRFFSAIKRVHQTALALGLFLLTFVSCKTNDSLVYATIETKAIATEMDGSYVLRVQGNGTTREMARGNAIRQAVHDVIFKNIYKTYDDHKMIYALISEPTMEQTYEDFFNRFFSSNGEYLKYVDTTRKAKLKFESYTNRTIIMNVVVNRAALKQMLQSANLTR